MEKNTGKVKSANFVTKAGNPALFLVSKACHFNSTNMECIQILAYWSKGGPEKFNNGLCTTFPQALALRSLLWSSSEKFTQ